MTRIVQVAGFAKLGRYQIKLQGRYTNKLNN
jgi:hypothetical protein